MSRKALLIAAFVVAMAGRSYAGVFADVPFNHWAYQAVEKLAAAGVLEGYPDGKYRGPQPMTRYEFAVAVARAYDWIRKTLGTDPDEIRKLWAELKRVDGKTDGLASKADLDALGGKLSALDRKVDDHVKRLDTRIDGLATQKGLDAVSGKVSDLDSKLTEEIKDRKSGDDALQTGLNDLKAQHEKDLANANGKIDATNKRVDSAEGRIKALEDAVKALQDLTKEFDKELKDLGANVAKIKTDLAALSARVTALEGRVNDHETRIAALERFKFYGDMDFSFGFDGAGRKGDLDFKPGEAYTTLSTRLGVDIAISNTVSGRVAWWYDSDSNRFHGSDARHGGLASVGIDEAWVKTPGLGGKWIFGRQYAGQDYETGNALYGLGLGTGYYTGAALNGIKGQYDFGKRIKLTGLVQADDNTSADVGGFSANTAAVIRGDAHLPWLKDKAGKDGVSFGLQAAATMPNAAAVAVGPYKTFNDGTSSREWSMSANAHVNVLKGLDFELTSQFQNTAGNSPDIDGDGEARGEAFLLKLGVLKTPTFKLDVAAGYVGNDFNLSYSGIVNQYAPGAYGVANALFNRSIFLGSKATESTQGAPTQGFDINFGWNIGHRPLNIRWTGSSLKADAFNWSIYGDFPIVQTGSGDVKFGIGYIDVDPTHPLANNTVAANINAGFRF